MRKNGKGRYQFIYKGTTERFITSDFLKSAAAARTFSRMDRATVFLIHRSAVCGGSLESSDSRELRLELKGTIGNEMSSSEL